MLKGKLSGKEKQVYCEERSGLHFSELASQTAVRQSKDSLFEMLKALKCRPPEGKSYDLKALKDQTGSNEDSSQC